MIFDEILKMIEQFDTITLFRHENPDCDAVGSQFGLKTWIEDHYPNKKVYALGTKDCTQGIWPHFDEVDDEVIENSLAIVLDTANKERIDDQRFQLAQKLIKIDHHINREPYGDICYVNEISAATCQILTMFMKHFEDKTISITCASYLYAGLLTDTLNYTTSNTTSDTLLAGSYLARVGIDVPRIARSVFDRSFHEFTFAGYIRSHVTRQDDRFAFVKIEQDVYEQYHLTPSEARNFVDELGHIQEIDIWAIFTGRINENGEKVYDASLRSKQIQINTIAEKYHGGGHKNACGIKNLTSETLANLIADLVATFH